MASASTYPRPLLSRPTDLAIVLLFSLHSFFVGCVDCIDLWPAWVTSPRSITPFFTAGRMLSDYYLETYQDKFFVEKPAWFMVCSWMELVLHLPTCFFAVWAAWNDSPLLPLGIIPWTVETFASTLICLVELWQWEDRTDAVKWGITGCYGPYLVISAWLFVVMSLRVKDALLLQRTTQQQGKVKGQ